MNPLDTKISIGELLKIGAIVGPLLLGGVKFYSDFKSFRIEMQEVRKELKYIHGIFKDAEEKPFRGVEENGSSNEY